MGTPSKAVTQELLRLADERGGLLRPLHVVEAARDPQSVLHSQFTWDDDKAAHEWRLQQARSLLSVVVIARPIGNGKAIEHRVFVSLSSDRKKGGDGYRVTSQVFTNEVQRMQLLTDAKRELKHFTNKYRTLNELAAVFVAIDSVISEDEPVEAPAVQAATA